MRKPLIAGNAKMNLERESLAGLLERLGQEIERRAPSCDVVYCPPFTLLAFARKHIGEHAIALGAQNMSAAPRGAYTGEISAGMLREAGCRYVILGHSERRALFGETDLVVRGKTEAALAADLVPIVCVGETEEDRERGATTAVLTGQVEGSLGGLAVAGPDALVVAYEPVWAIGTGKTATPGMAQEAHAHLRGELGRVLGEGVARGIRILYGGSVKPGNATDLLEEPDIDGALVGGASLDPESFLGIVYAVGA